MNEDERASQVSALFDGQLEASQSDLVLRRVMKDPALRSAWGRYALIGASLRGEPLSVGSVGRMDVAARVAVAMNSEPELTVRHTASDRGGRSAWAARAYKAVWGTALAASVAAGSILVLRTQGLPASGASIADVAAPVPAEVVPVGAPAQPVRVVAAADAPAPSYTTPVGNGSNSAIPAPLVNYVVAHTEYLTPVMRFNPLSAAMMGSFEPGDELVEATEAEIGAVRR